MVQVGNQQMMIQSTDMGDRLALSMNKQMIAELAKQTEGNSSYNTSEMRRNFSAPKQSDWQKLRRATQQVVMNNKNRQYSTGINYSRMQSEGAQRSSSKKSSEKMQSKAGSSNSKTMKAQTSPSLLKKGLTMAPGRQSQKRNTGVMKDTNGFSQVKQKRR